MLELVLVRGVRRWNDRVDELVEEAAGGEVTEEMAQVDAVIPKGLHG